MPNTDVTIKFRRSEGAKALYAQLEKEKGTKPYVFGMDGRTVFFKYEREKPALVMLKTIALTLRKKQKAVEFLSRRTPQKAVQLRAKARKHEIQSVTVYRPNQKGEKYTLQRVMQEF